MINVVICVANVYVISFTCPSFTSGKTPSLRLTSAYQPARALGGQIGSTTPPTLPTSAWHKLYRIQPHSHTGGITKHHFHPEMLSKMAIG